MSIYLSSSHPLWASLKLAKKREVATVEKASERLKRDLTAKINQAIVQVTIEGLVTLGYPIKDLLLHLDSLRALIDKMPEPLRSVLLITGNVDKYYCGLVAGFDFLDTLNGLFKPEEQAQMWNKVCDMSGVPEYFKEHGVPPSNALLAKTIEKEAESWLKQQKADIEARYQTLVYDLAFATTAQTATEAIQKSRFAIT